MRHRNPSILLAIAGLTAVIASPASRASAPAVPATQSSPATRPLLVPRNDIPGLPNFAKVSDRLYRGAQPTAEGFATLKKMGIKTVVNLRSFSSDRIKLRGTGLGYAHIYCKAWHPENEDTLKFLKLVTDPANHPIFVHCQHGADRTGSLVAVYRVVEQNWAMADAIEEMHRFGFHVMWTQIIEYLQKFQPEKTRKRLEKVRMPDIDVVE